MSYEQQLIKEFTSAYRCALLKKRRHRYSMTKKEFYEFNLLFATRWDAKNLTCFRKYVCKEFPDLNYVSAFDFSSGKILDI